MLREAAPAAVTVFEYAEVVGSEQFVRTVFRRRVEAAGHLARQILRTLNLGDAGALAAQVVGFLTYCLA